jgi:hypothetical protein
MSDSNRIKVALKEEITPGVAPAGPYQQINVSSVNLTTQKTTAEENTIRDDRNLRGLIMTSLIPQGGFGFDMIFGNLDSILPGIFGSALTSFVNIVAENTTVAANVITANIGTPFSVVVVGQWIRIQVGVTVYVVRVTAVGGSGASVTVVGATIPDGAATMTVNGQMIRNGTTMKHYTVEQQHADLVVKGFYTSLGMVPNTFNLNAQAETVVTGDVGFMGIEPPPPADVSASGGAYTAPVDAESFAALKGNIGQFMFNGTLITPAAMAIRGINMSLTNNVRRDAAINVVDMGWGQCTVTGQCSTFLRGGEAAIDAYFNHSNSSLSYVMTDPAGNLTILTILRLKFGNFTKQVGGKNQAVMGDLDYTGILDPVTGATIQMDFIPAP